MEVYLRKCGDICSIYKQCSWIYACDLYFMTFRAGSRGEWREWWNFLAQSLDAVSFMHFVLILSVSLSICVCVSRSLSHFFLRVSHSIFLYPVIHPDTHTHTRVRVLTHNPRQFLLLFKGISSESNYISGEGGLNSF